MEWNQDQLGIWRLWPAGGGLAIRELPPGASPPNDNIPKYDNSGGSWVPLVSGVGGMIGSDADNRLDDVLTAMGMARPGGVNGPGLPGLGLAGDWLANIKRWLQDHFGQYWWLLLAAVILAFGLIASR